MSTATPPELARESLNVSTIRRDLEHARDLLQPQASARAYIGKAREALIELESRLLDMAAGR